MRAHELAQQAADILKQRGIENGYDAGEERSAAKIATVFNAITGHNLTEQDAWMFLICLKLVRQGRKHQTDNLLDLSNYALLLAESHGNPEISDCIIKDDCTIKDAFIGGSAMCGFPGEMKASYQTMTALGYEFVPDRSDEKLRAVIEAEIIRMTRPGGRLYVR